MAGPGPAVNAAASANSVSGTDPTLRDPNAALQYYTQRTSPEVVVGVIFIVLLVLFGLALPYRPPESSLGAFLWRRRLWFETTFALSMLQPWEKLVLREYSSSRTVLCVRTARR